MSDAFVLCKGLMGGLGSVPRAPSARGLGPPFSVVDQRCDTDCAISSPPPVTQS